MYTGFFDGACEWHRGKRNPGGIATYGWLIYYRDKIVVARGWGEVIRGDGATNNVAEYHALCRLLTAFTDAWLHGELLICGDSKLVINQMTGEYQVRSPLLRPLYTWAKELSAPIEPRFQWVPREQNSVADALSKQAYQDARLRIIEEPWDQRFLNQGAVIHERV